MKYVELEILLTNGTRQKIAPVFDVLHNDNNILDVEDYDNERYTYSKSKVAKATFRVKEGEYYAN